MFDVRSADLRKINSMTKYPSIPTYHTIDPKNGMLLEDPWPPFGNELVYGTEKIDGTNARIIVLPDSTVIVGSKEELLWSAGDLIEPVELGIVEAMKSLAMDFASRPPLGGSAIATFYFEVYGGEKLPARKNYTSNGELGYRLFDVSTVNLDMLDWSRERIASWRDNGGQNFLNEQELNQVDIPRVPVLFEMYSGNLPIYIDDMYTFLKDHMPTTLAALDEGAKGIPEGIVLRTANRGTIAKVRFEDYARTIRKRS